MSETVERRFRVDEFVDGRNIVWLELEEGSKKGLQFAIPTRSPEYDPELEAQIARLDEDDQIVAELVSENERNTAWRFVSIEPNEGTRQTTPAGD